MNSNEFMNRAIEIARKGLGNVSPNPHVGAVIVADGRIIGEGFHRRWGGPHAEVNAVASVSDADRRLLPSSTIYVTLEPCAHYGKTPPCAKLIIDSGIRHVVVGCTDPNPKVDGGGIAMMRQAGVKVDVLEGEIADACHRLDPKFMSRFTKGRPFITLKWAQSADGFMSYADGSPARLSTPLTQTLVHRLRSHHDAVLTSASTVMTDNPRLDSRLWSSGRNPLRVIVDRSQRLGSNRYAIFSDTDNRPIVYNCSIEEAVDDLDKNHGINSILVEAGPGMLGSFLKAGLWDTARIEISSLRLGDQGGFRAPDIPSGTLATETIDNNTIITVNHENV